LLSAVPDPDYYKKLGVVRSKAISVIAEALKLHKVDVIVSLADARIASLAATAGIAVGTLPMGFADFNGRACGLCVIAGENGEGKILEVMSAWEKLFPEAQVPPPMLVNWGQESHL
jgi:amidase